MSTNVKKRDKLTQELAALRSDLAGVRRSLEVAESEAHSKPKESPCFEYKFPKHLRSDKFSKEKMELEIKLEENKKDVQEKQKKILELQHKVREFSKIESQLEDKTRRLERSNKEKDILEKELIAAKSQLASVKNTLELERLERKESETHTLNVIRDAKRKWENDEKEKIEKLNKHIELQTTKITELCASNNEMSSRLDRTQCELQTANAELKKLRVFQTQYKESLAKTRELSRQSVQGIEVKLEEIATRSHNQLADLRAKLDFEAAKNTDLETRLRNEQDSNHCRESRLNIALEFAQNELKDCQEQLRNIQATLPARDGEIETLRKQLQERARQIDDLKTSEQICTTMQEQLDRINLENEQLKQQLQATKSDLNETMMNLEQSEALALNLEQAAQDKVTLQKRLQHSLEKEEEQLRKVCNLEELLKRLEQSVTKLEAENASLKQLDNVQAKTRLITEDVKVFYGKEKVEKLEKQLQDLREEITVKKETARQAQRTLREKERELSKTDVEARLALKKANRLEEKVNALEEEKQKLLERLYSKTKDEQENSKKLLKELEIAKASLNDITKEASRNKMHADSAQRALTEANRQIEELQSSSASLRRELDAARKQVRSAEERMDTLNAENRRLMLTSGRHNEEKIELESKIAKLEQDIKGHELNEKLLKETCTVLEEQLMDYEKLTSDHETRENTLIQDKMKLQKDLEAAETEVRKARIAQNDEKKLRIVAERNIEQLESETSDIESERNSLIAQRDQYVKRTQELNAQVKKLTTSCDQMECNLMEMGRALETAEGKLHVMMEENSQNLTRAHELEEANAELMNSMQNSIEKGQELRLRISELEGVLEDMRQFYQEREVKAEGTRQQQTKLIDYLQMRLEECSKKKKTMCDKILGTKQKENVPPVGTGMPVGYRELENQLANEREKVKRLTEQLLIMKARITSASAPTSPTTPERDGRRMKGITETSSSLIRQLSPQRIESIRHTFATGLPMRAGRCATCSEPIQFGRYAATCNKCQIMTHLDCTMSVPVNCDSFEFTKFSYRDDSDDSLSSIGDSVQTLAIDQPDNPVKLDSDSQSNQHNENEISMEGWVKVPGKSKSCWERKYMKLEGSCLCIFEHQPCAGMSPISRLNLLEDNGFNVYETVQQTDILGTDKSDIPLIFRVESNSTTTCWPSTRLDVVALNKTDKKNWLKALRALTGQNSYAMPRYQKYQTILKLDKHQLDLNCVVDLGTDNVLLLGAKEGLFSYYGSKSQTLTTIRGVKQVHQLSLHSHLDLALMIAGEYRELVYCNLRLLKTNALAADCSKPAISTKCVLSTSDSCHLYQLQGEILCVATETRVTLLKWKIGENCEEFVEICGFETPKPCSCAIFTSKLLIIGCHKFYQIDLQTLVSKSTPKIDATEFPEGDSSSIKAALSGAAKLDMFPVSVLNISNTYGTAELLLCYNEFGVFVDENGRRTRAMELMWNHLPFAFAFCKPYLFIIHFSSVEIVKLDSEAYKSPDKNPERTFIELSSPRYLGTAGSKGIYVAAINSFLELLKIDVSSEVPALSGSFTSLDTLAQEDESSSEFSFTSSLMEALDGQGKKVHFAGLHKY